MSRMGIHRMISFAAGLSSQVPRAEDLASDPYIGSVDIVVSSVDGDQAAIAGTRQVRRAAARRANKAARSAARSRR